MVRISPANSSSQPAPISETPSACRDVIAARLPGTSAGSRYPLRDSLLQISIEELCYVGESFFRLRRIDIELVLRVRLSLIDIEIGNHAGAAQFAMRANRVAEEQVARTRCQDGRRKAFEVAIDRRDVGRLQVCPVGVELCGAAE